MKKLFLLLVAITILILPNLAGAATVLNVTDSFATPGGIETYNFLADETPLTYRVTLTDLNFLNPFDVLQVLISHGATQDLIVAATGSDTFNAVFGTEYSATVAGTIESVPGGTYNLDITAVPIPQAITLLISGIFGIIYLRRNHRLR